MCVCTGVLCVLCVLVRSWVFSSAVRAGVAPSVIFPRWYSSLHTQSRRNRMVAFAGLCSDSLGAVAFIHDMCVQSQEGFLRLFPGWPGDLSASFNTLRMKGATLVSSVYVGKPEWAGTIAGVTGGVANITVQCESDGPVSILSPWPAAPQSDITVSDGGAPVTISWSTVGGFMGGPMFTFPTTAGHAYIVTSLPSL